MEKRISNMTGMFTDELGFALSLDAVLGAVENAPSVGAEPVRHGRWVADVYDAATLQVIGTVTYTYDAQIEFSAKRGIMLGAPYCELCKEGALELQEECITSGYCPNCGAKMMEGDLNETD